MQKRRYLLILLLFGLFIVEGTIIPWLIPVAWQTRLIPHLVFVVILFASVYDNRHRGLVLGLVFGLLQDVVYYGSMIGAYSFAMGFSAYMIGLIFKSRRTPLPLMMFAVLIGSLLLESLLYGTYRLFELTHQTYDWALTNHMIPNMIVQFIFALAIYVPLRRWLENAGVRRSKEEAA
ncbi:rod shape-determining protein MreD [Paenibacillus sp. CAA11]|uniref:rod shape-determining protein MreD n=1 Tax=Paenibacillus sp. CAA11 TaxID=1532905 RepID=UPI000D3B376E|nr:rod shape-determining protein MreD [Paenibacillus sp. CAA11]AWB45723.1 rod shape-determining protein MreD [Paenibacillus sp. CAA11]